MAEPGERSEKSKRLAGELYDASDSEIQDHLAAAQAWMVRYNAALALSATERRQLLLERFGAGGEGSVVRPPFHCDYGYNISIGANVFPHFTCVYRYVVPISLGDQDHNAPGG